MKRFVCSYLCVFLSIFWGVAAWAQAEADAAYLDEDALFEDDFESAFEPIWDPLEPVNRITFKFNDVVYTYVYDPIAQVYVALLPEPVRNGATNFFSNLRAPVRVTGNLLQGRWSAAWNETARFGVNSTVGLLGVLDPASQIEGYEKLPPEGVAQAFGAWGIGEGPYLVIPFMGPSSLRDVVGTYANSAVNPWLRPFTVLDEWEYRTTYLVGLTLTNMPDLMDRYTQVKNAAFDPYSSLKNGYTQYSRQAVAE